MKQSLVSINDILARTFQRPWASPSLAVAIRAYVDEMRNPDSPLAKHPEDYDLYEVATFDDETAIVESFPEPRLLLTGAKAFESLSSSPTV